MKLVLQRTTNTGVILGTLTVDGVHECFTLEDPDSAHDRIDAGTYNVIIDDSTRFKRKMPHVIGNPAVDDRGIRIHAGNTEADTVGCILVGRSQTPTSVGESRDAFNALFAKLESSLARGEQVTLEVADDTQKCSLGDQAHDAPQPQTGPRPDNAPSLMTSLFGILAYFLKR